MQVLGSTSQGSLGLAWGGGGWAVRGRGSVEVYNLEMSSKGNICVCGGVSSGLNSHLMGEETEALRG